MKDRSSFRRNSQIRYWIERPNAGTIGLGGVGFGLLMSGALSATGSLVSANAAKKAAGQAGQASQVDVNALDETTRRIALKNAQDSAALEQAMTPEVPQLRQQANQAIIDQMGPNASEAYGLNALGSLASTRASGGPVGATQTPLLAAAIAKAKQDLAMGGQLSPDVRNAVYRQGLATAGTVGGGNNLGLGRDVAARDLGLTSLQLEQQRLANASLLGGQELNQAQGNQASAAGDRAFGLDALNSDRTSLINALQLMSGVQGNQFNRALAAGQYGQGIPQPIVGLDPSSVANVVVGNANNQGAAAANQANIYGAQSRNYMQLGGNLLGSGLLAYNNSYKPKDNSDLNFL